ncbi:MAG: polyphosphate kinase, partial [Sphingomonadales bacterium]|nr:polyphosphate kinase [Sphingomonadales bacterium]
TAGRTSLFCGSWYRELVLDRLSGRLGDKAWSRRCDEVNEFEAQQRDEGTALIKLFFDVAAPIQAERLTARDADSWRRWTAPTERPRSRDAEQAAWSDLFARTDTRWAPWLLIDANDLDAAEENALSAIAEALGKAIPSDPPVEAQRAAG